MMSCDRFPFKWAMNPTPQASFSRDGCQRPWGSGQPNGDVCDVGIEVIEEIEIRHAGPPRKAMNRENKRTSRSWIALESLINQGFTHDSGRNGRKSAFRRGGCQERGWHPPSAASSTPGKTMKCASARMSPSIVVRLRCQTRPQCNPRSWSKSASRPENCKDSAPKSRDRVGRVVSLESFSLRPSVSAISFYQIHSFVNPHDDSSPALSELICTCT